MKLPNSIPTDIDGQYCIKCFKGPLHRVYKDNLTFYECENCKEESDRSIVIDHKIVFEVRVDGTYWHESVGIFLFNHQNKVLFFDRTIYPFALTIPAGHLDVGEDVTTAAGRELTEETGITNVPIKLFSKEDVRGDACRRGCDDHRWNLFTAHIGFVPEVEIQDEGINPVWLSLDEALQKKLVHPVRYFIEKYGKNLLK